MLLKSLDYVEHLNDPRMWHVESMSLGQINLIVGKNSSGKSRVLNVIDVLAKLVSGKIQGNFDSGTWIAEFIRHKGQTIEQQNYQISFRNKIIAHESLTIKDSKVMERTGTGEGYVLRKKGTEKVKYKIPTDQLMAVVRRDEYQHPQFENLFNWGNSSCTYRFGSEFGKNLASAMSISPSENMPALDISALADNASSVFQASLNKFGSQYSEHILRDMEDLGYPCESISLSPLSNISISGIPPVILTVKESNLDCTTSQHEMSQGMYRALALCIHINANIFWTQSKMIGRAPGLGDSPMIIIDDIGEGLDHTRARKLIQLLISKALNNKIQLVMSSNDRYIMNDIPLEYWTVLHRTGSTVKAFNYSNSKSQFDEFEYLGLNNFDFFSGEYFLQEQQ